MRTSASPARAVVRRSLHPVLLGAAVLALATGCSSGSTTVQRVAPGVATSTTSTDAAGTSWSMRARNVDLAIKNAAVHLGPSGTARLEFTVDNEGPVAEHLDTVSVPGLGQATLQGSAGAANALSTAGVLIYSGGSATFGTAAPSVTLPPSKDLKAGGTTQVLLVFGIAGLVHLTVPVLAG
jgi:hypothetical protein